MAVEKHEFYQAEDFYEFQSVGTRARSDKVCGHCGGLIKKGTPHLMAKFYPEFEGPAIHKNCEKEFLESLN